MDKDIHLKIFTIFEPFINDKNSKNDFMKINGDVSFVKIIKLLYSEYTIFLTGKYYNNYLFNFKKKLLKYFDKYNIIYLNYKYKNKIINLVNILNSFIKNATNELKENLINILFQYKIINENLFDIKKKMKQIIFLENNYEPNILYKKIQFSNQEIYIPFDTYVIKKMEYKLRTYCQIAEKMGAEKIIIEYNSSTNQYKNDTIFMNLNFLYGSGGIGVNTTKQKNNDEKIQIVFEYSNNHSDINLNKFFIVDLILNENEFLITKEEFESDVELKYLIDTRCINFIQKYNTNFIMNQINKIEQKIFLKANNYGLQIGNLNYKDNYISITISIDFVQIHNHININIINGTNIYILREGFSNLCDIIKKNNKYEYIVQFLKSYLNGIEKKWITLQYEYEYIEDVNIIYHDIIELNFNENELNTIIQQYFQNNLYWHSFKKFRDIILLGSDDFLNKIYFISFQYHSIINNTKNIMNYINKYIHSTFNNYINNIFNMKLYERKFNSNSDFHDNKYNSFQLTFLNIDHFLIIDFLKNNETYIKDILYETFKKSFYYSNGLTENITQYEKLVKVIKNILYFYYDNKIIFLQLKLNQISASSLNEENLLFNIKKIFFDKIIEEICKEIIKNLNVLDSLNSDNLYSSTTENLNSNFKVNILENYEKETLYVRIQKLFLKFIINFFTFENNIHKIIYKLNLDIKYLENNNNVVDLCLLIPFLEDFIPINNIYKNYNEYKLFYTWKDFLHIKNYFEEKK